MKLLIVLTALATAVAAKGICHGPKGTNPDQYCCDAMNYHEQLAKTAFNCHSATDKKFKGITEFDEYCEKTYDDRYTCCDSVNDKGEGKGCF